MEQNIPESKTLPEEHLDQVNGGVRNMTPTDAQLKFLQRGQCPRCWKKIELADGGWFCKKCNVFFPFNS